MTSQDRNSPCLCGSGKKYKKCCFLTTIPPASTNLDYKRVRKLANQALPAVHEFAESTLGRDCHLIVMPEFLCWPEDDEMESLNLDREEARSLHELYATFTVFQFLPGKLTATQNRIWGPNETAVSAFLRNKVNRERIGRDQVQVLESLKSTIVSFWEISAVASKAGLELRDLLAPEKPAVFVSEGTLTDYVRRGDIVYGAVGTVGTVNMFLGLGDFPIQPRSMLDVIELREDLVEMAKDEEGLLDHERAEITRELFWDLRHQAFNSAPTFSNTDGDYMEQHVLRYEIEDPEAVLEALYPLSMDTALDKFRQHACKRAEHTKSRAGANPEVRSDGEVVYRFPWNRAARKGNAASLDAIVFAGIEIAGTSLKIEANSRQRAGRVKAEIKRRLKDRAKLMAVEITDQEAMIRKLREDRAAGRMPVVAEQEKLLHEIPPEALQQIAARGRAHWIDWIDRKLPALAGQTPKQASKTERGRELLRAVFTDFERSAAPSALQKRSLGDVTHLMAPDVEELRRKLGMVEE